MVPQSGNPNTKTTWAAYGVTPVARPSAITQTLATTATTVANRTAVTISTADVGLVLADVVTLLNETKAKVNALIVDDLNTVSVLNKVLDNLQLQGLAQ